MGWFVLNELASDFLIKIKFTKMQKKKYKKKSILTFETILLRQSSQLKLVNTTSWIKLNQI